MGRAETDAAHRLSLTLTDLSLLTFDITLSYRRGAQTLSETLHIERSTRTANSGRFLLTLLGDPQALLTGVRLGFEGANRGSVTAQLCR